MSRWERELLNAETAGWVRRDTPRSALAIPLDLEEIIGRRWSQERIAELEAALATCRAAIKNLQRQIPMSPTEAAARHRWEEQREVKEEP